MSNRTISINMPVRSAPDWTQWALASLANSVHSLGWQDRVDVLLIDDASDPALGVGKLLADFRTQSKLRTRIIRFKQNQHYTRALSAALSMSQGEKIFFLSNDMVFSPEYFRTLLDVSDLDPGIGVVRGTSNHCDSHEEHQVQPPFPIRGMPDIQNFSKFVCAYWGQHFVQDKVLSADAVCFNRALIDKIGGVDTRYFGYFGDLEYGLRAIRAGFKLVCARGAWLLHHGGGYIKDQAVRENIALEQVHAKRLAVVQKAYDLFRAKWDPSMPENYTEGFKSLDRLQALEPMDLHRYIDPVPPSPDDYDLM